MNVRYTKSARTDLAEIVAFLNVNYPTIVPAFTQRLEAIVAHLAEWPQSAPAVAGRPGVRVIPLTRYPYRVFYRVTATAVVILHIHHTSRQEPTSR